MRVAFLTFAWLCVCGLASAQNGKAIPKVARPGAKAAKQIPRSIPNAQIERLQRMTPEQREKALASLAPERRARIEKQLNRLDQLSPQQRQQLEKRFDALQSLPPARQRAVRQEVQSLRNMPFAERRARLASGEFQRLYSPEEQDLIRGVFPGAAR